MRRIVSDTIARRWCVVGLLSTPPSCTPKRRVASGHDGASFISSSPHHSPQNLHITTDEKGITTMALARAPVNSLSRAFFTEINESLRCLGKEKGTRALILTSAIPTIYSAGLDLAEVYNPSRENLTELWRGFQDLWINLNSFSKPIVAAITGNSPAGGCIMAMGCDYRVMARGPKGGTNPKQLYRIGLNEVQVGLGLAPWITDGCVSLLGPRKAERLIMQGNMPLADEALQLGLIDEVATDESEALAAAHREATQSLQVPQKSRALARIALRRTVLQTLSTPEGRSRDAADFMECILDPVVQANLGEHLARLRQRSRK